MTDPARFNAPEAADAAAMRRLEARIAALESGSSSPSRFAWAASRRMPSRAWRWVRRGVLIAVVLAMPTMVAASHVFTDVPTTSSFHTVIGTVKAAGLTAGCTATTYCPAEPVRRDQMAAFLVRSAGRMGFDTVPDLTPVADQPFASITIRTEGRAQIWANATFYMNLVRGGSNLFPCQARTYIAIDDVIDTSSHAYGVADAIPTVSGSITEQIGQQSVKVVNGGFHVVELFYDGVIVGSCGVTTGKGYLTAIVVPFDENGTNP